jgi:hypothetical protein
MDLPTLVQTLGLPIALAVFFIWMYVSQAKEHKQDLKDIAIKSVLAIDAGTDAIRDSTEQMKLNNTALGENSHIMNDVKSVLSTRGVQQNGMGNGS